MDLADTANVHGLVDTASNMVDKFVPVSFQVRMPPKLCLIGRHCFQLVDQFVPVSFQVRLPFELCLTAESQLCGCAWPWKQERRRGSDIFATACHGGSVSHATPVSTLLKVIAMCCDAYQHPSFDNQR